MEPGVNADRAFGRDHLDQPSPYTLPGGIPRIKADPPLINAAVSSWIDAAAEGRLRWLRGREQSGFDAGSDGGINGG